VALALRKLKRILEGSFPPPDKLDLRDEDGIIGVITSRRFRRMDTMERQNLIHDILNNARCTLCATHYQGGRGQDDGAFVPQT